MVTREDQAGLASEWVSLQFCHRAEIRDKSSLSLGPQKVHRIIQSDDGLGWKGP